MTPTPCSTHHFLAAAALLVGLAAQAQPITLTNNSINMFRDTRGASDIGQTSGDRLQFGANIVGGSAGTTVRGVYGGFSTPFAPCAPLSVDPNFCSTATVFNSNRLGSWTIEFERGSDTLSVTGPTLAGAEQSVPFPVSVSLSGTGLQPTMSWKVPGTFAPDALRVLVYDKNNILENGVADVIHSVAIAGDATSYTLPLLLSSNQSLSQNGNYTLGLQLIDTRAGSGAFTNNNAQILRRSNAFFAFTPLTGNVPDDVALPTVIDGVYNFNIAEVGPESITFIDPFVAIGYDYAIGEGDPNFASVLLPDVGDGQFTLEFTGAAGAQSVSVADGTQYFFGGNGVGSFRVTGIETSAMLDPSNVTAFITGLTFAAEGAFTGTMTPITQFVPAAIPEPQTYALMALGLLAIGVARRRAKA